MADDFMGSSSVAEGIAWQADHVAANNAPATSRVVRAQLALLNGSTKVGRTLREWPETRGSQVLEGAVPLRLAGGLHHLHLTGAEDALWPVYRLEITDQAAVDSLVADVVTRHDDTLLPWFDSPPQTNEAGRSASFMAGLLWLSAHGIGPRFALNELGASAGINTMMERYYYDLGGVQVGPTASPMRLVPVWRGPPPPVAPVEIVSIKGCDQMPQDLSNPDSALRIKSYVWPENADRIARMDAAIALAAERAPDVVKADAADWVEAVLAEPQQARVVRVIHHSIVWQYIPTPAQHRITHAIEVAGAAATPDRPLVWMMLETNRATFAHELTVRVWDGGEHNGAVHLLGSAQAHGAWVKWLKLSY
jgi:hypothetical protein